MPVTQLKTNSPHVTNLGAGEVNTPPQTTPLAITPVKPGEAPRSANTAQETRLRTLSIIPSMASKNASPLEQLRTLGGEIRAKEERLERLLFGGADPETRLDNSRGIQNWHNEIKKKEKELEKQSAEQKKVLVQVGRLTPQYGELKLKKENLTHQRDELDAKIRLQNLPVEKPAADKPDSKLQAGAASVAPAANPIDERIQNLKAQKKAAQARLDELAEEKKPFKKAQDKARETVKKARLNMAKEDKAVIDQPMKVFRQWAVEFNDPKLNALLSQCAQASEIPRELKDGVTERIYEMVELRNIVNGEDESVPIDVYRLFVMYASAILPGYAKPFVEKVNTLDDAFRKEYNSATNSDELLSTLAESLGKALEDYMTVVEKDARTLRAVAREDARGFGNWPGPKNEDQAEEFYLFVDDLYRFGSDHDDDNSKRGRAQLIVNGIVSELKRQSQRLQDIRGEDLEKRGMRDAPAELEKIYEQEEKERLRVQELGRAIHLAEEEAMKAPQTAAKPQASGASVRPSMVESAPAADLHLERSKVQGRLDECQEKYAACKVQHGEQNKIYKDIGSTIEQLQRGLMKLGDQVDMSKNRHKRNQAEIIRERESKIEPLRAELEDIKKQLDDDPGLGQIISSSGWQRVLKMHLDMSDEKLTDRLSSLDRASQYTSLGVLMQALEEILENAEQNYPDIMQARSRQEYEQAGGDGKIDGRRCPHTREVGSGFRKRTGDDGTEVVEEYICLVSKYVVRFDDERGRAVIDHVHPWAPSAI